MEPASELIRMLSSDNFFDRQKAAWKLVEMGAEALEPLMEALLSEKNSQARFKSAWALGEIKDPSAVGALVQALLEDEDEAVREWSAFALEAIGDTKAVTPLVQSLKSDESEAVRIRAAQALIVFEVADVFMDLLEESDVLTRQMAVIGLGRLKCVEATEMVASQIEDENVGLRRRAAWALGEMGTFDAGTFLKPALEDESHVVRMTAAKSLASVGGIDACRMALKLIEDEHPQVRLTAVTTLGELELSEALSHLVEKMFGEDDEEIRAWAAWSLGEIGDPAAIEALKEACKSCPPQVQEKARDSLVQVFGLSVDESEPAEGLQGR